MAAGQPTWVAMPAWSVPGTQRVWWPSMRCQRVRQSSMAVVSAWPRCSEPVTFGGGITITNCGEVCAALSDYTSNEVQS